MDNWLNYHHLYYFMVIASEGSISKASKRLLLGQPTLSAQLKQFEEKLGVELFERQHKRLILTDSGRIALEYAREIFKLGDEMKGVLQERLVPSKTPVTLGMLDGVSKSIGALMIEKALRFAPCKISSIEGRSDYLIRELLAYRVDLVLTNHRPQVADGKKIKSRLIGKLPVVICGGEKYKDLKKNFPRSLHKQPFILPTQHSRLRYDLDHYFEVNKIKPDILAEVEDFSLYNTLGSRGLALIPITELSFRLKQSKKLHIIGELEGVFTELYLVSTSRRIENPVASHLFNTFRL